MNRDDRAVRTWHLDWFMSWDSWNLPWRNESWNQSRAWTALRLQGIRYDSKVYGLAAGPLTIWVERYNIPVSAEVQRKRKQWERLNTVAWDVWRMYQAPDGAASVPERLDRLDRIFVHFGFSKPLRNGYGGYFGGGVWY